MALSIWFHRACDRSDDLHMTLAPAVMSPMACDADSGPCSLSRFVLTLQMAPGRVPCETFRRSRAMDCTCSLRACIMLCTKSSICFLCAFARRSAVSVGQMVSHHDNTCLPLSLSLPCACDSAAAMAVSMFACRDVRMLYCDLMLAWMPRMTCSLSPL